MSTVAQLPCKEAEALAEFMKCHPELKAISTHPNFISVGSSAVALPEGVIATVNGQTKLSTSILPEKQLGTVSLYQISDNFSEIEHLGQRDKLIERTAQFLSKTGLGPDEHDVALPTTGYLPKHWGKDLKEWKPIFGDHAYVSVLGDNTNSYEKSYYLMVVVPNLPFANESIQPLTLLSAKDLSQHENTKIAQKVAQRNTNKIAHLFSDTFKIGLRHRRPDTDSLTGISMPVPIASTLNVLLTLAKPGEVKINSGLGFVQNNGWAIFPLSPKSGAILSQKRVEDPIALPTISKTSLKLSVQEIGKTFLNERTFWQSRGKTVAPEVLLYDRSTNELAKEINAKYGGIPLVPVFLVANQ